MHAVHHHPPKVLPGRMSRGKLRWPAVGIVVAVLSVLPVAGADGPDESAPADTDDAAWTKTVEAGAGYGWFSDPYGNGNGQFVRFSLTRPWRHLLRFELNRGDRFGLDGVSLGVTYARTLANKTTLSVGLAGGTGDLSPKYRFDASVTWPTLEEGNLLLSVGYKDDKSKFDNGSRGLWLGGVYYKGHWVAQGNVRYDRGRPGNTDSYGAAAGLTWYIYKKLYLGFGFDWGDSSYLVVGPGDVQVDVQGRSYNFNGSYWLNDSSGINFRVEYGSNSIYSGSGVQLSYFKEWR